MSLRFFQRPNAVAAAPVQTRERIAVALDDGRSVEVLRVRDARAKRIKLSVSERGARLTLPLRASLIAGDRFLAEHREWLSSQLDRLTVADGAALEPGLAETLPLRGEALPLHWGGGRFVRLRVDDDGVHCALPEKRSDAAWRRALRDFYEAQARADVGRWLPRYLSDLPRAPRRVQFKRMSSQWGSLSPDGTVALDLSLVLGAPAAFEYVLVHELCHLIHHDHSPRFWREVEARCPDWKRHREYFREEGRALKATLQALVG
ncbi:MAG: M48 family metallopeptidase [Xanthomonadaceae bacterium]|nr:M48 family metallopeptidase [Xanthomonadaceae bacterium]